MKDIHCYFDENNKLHCDIDIQGTRADIFVMISSIFGTLADNKNEDIHKTIEDYYLLTQVKDISIFQKGKL